MSTEALNFEGVWQMFQETDRKFQETREQMKETDRRLKEAERLITENGKLIGKLGNSFGELAEHLVAPNIMEKFNEMGFIFTKTYLDTKVKNEKRICLAEVDIMLENGDTVIAVEVKSKPHLEDIEDFIDKMSVLRKWADDHNDKRIYYGAIAVAIMSDSVRNKILKTGFYVIEQTGDTVKINIPEGFKPREW